MWRLSLLLCLSTSLIAPSKRSQAPPDALVAAPDHYRIELENADVRIIRVIHAPHSRTLLHQHSSLPRVIVMLTTGTVVAIDAQGHETTRQTTAGRVLYNPSGSEIHAVENRGDIPVEALRIELKRPPQQQSP